MSIAAIIKTSAFAARTNCNPQASYLIVSIHSRMFCLHWLFCQNINSLSHRPALCFFFILANSRVFFYHTNKDKNMSNPEMRTLNVN